MVARHHRRELQAVCCVMALLLTGCLGPTSIRKTRSEYSEAVLTTGNQELLLNLVRLRYGEGVSFLPITSINAQFEFQAGALGRGGIDRGGESNFGEGRLGFADRPTLTFDPRRSTEVTRSLVSRFGIETIELMDAAGWDMDRIFRLLVEEVNSVDNAVRAGGPTPDFCPEFAEFRNLAAVINRLHVAGALAIDQETLQKDVPAAVPFKAPDVGTMLQIRQAGYGVRPLGDGQDYVLTESRPAQVLRVFPSAAHADDLNEFARILNLVPGLPFYELELSAGGQGRPAELPGQRTKLTVTTRSLLGLMYYLSQSVSVPPEHLHQGLVSVTLNADGTHFDWHQVSGDLLRICVSQHKPKHAGVSVEYRDYWYYIDDTDVRSKTTLAMLRELSRLQRVEAAEGQPLLTLPAGG